MVVEFVDLREEPDEALLEAVASGLYLDSFPFPEEREDPAGWRHSLWSPERDEAGLLLRIVVAGEQLRTPQRSIAGFVCSELYPHSRCGLISYLAVAPAARRAGLGAELVAHALAALERDAAETGEPLAAVFAEIHDPARVDAAADVIDPTQRVGFFASVGGRKVPVSYVQPELAPGQGAAHSLDLIVLWQAGSEVTSLPAEWVRGFLSELYEDDGADEDLLRMLGELAGERIALEPLDRRPERRTIEFDRLAIAFHFVLGADEPPLELAPAGPQLDSFERDLLAYSYRDVRPFTSQLVEVPLAFRGVELEVAPELRYVAEGRMSAIVSAPREQPCVLLTHASETQFRSGIVVRHLVLSPAEENQLYEYDIVRLIKLWEGGEDVDGPWDGVGAERCVRFGGQTIRELAAAVFRDPAMSDVPPRAGTVQLVDVGPPWPELWAAAADVVAFSAADPVRWQAVSQQVEGVAGIVQGILDLEEIDEDELGDVFAGGVEVGPDGLRGLHKGTLIRIAAADRAFEACAGTLGISPYLLIPHTVLLHNEEVLSIASRAADQASARRFRQLELAKSEMHRALDGALLPNVFHYTLEQRIYDEGHTSRGLDFRTSDVRRRLAEVTAAYQTKIERRRGIADDVRNGLLLVLSYTSYRTLFPHQSGLAAALVLAFVSLVYLGWRWAPPLAHWRLTQWWEARGRRRSA